ncbi:MAG TPA: glycosyltransferase family 4 protein [Alphaproteobacteria bacterium]
MTRAIVSHPSKQGNMYRIPAGAALCGFETVFLTGYYWRGPGAAMRLLRTVRPVAADRLTGLLARRRLPDLDPACVRRISGPAPELLYRFAGYPAGNWVHDRLAALWLATHVARGTRGIFHGFQESCASSLAAARRSGLATILEITLPPSTNAIVAAEHRRIGIPPEPAEPSPAFLEELGRTDYVVAQSRFSAHSAIAFGVEPGRVFQVPLGVDTERFRPAEAPAASRPFRALFTGQMSIRKGVHHLLEAWASVARGDDELLFAGYPREPYVVELVGRSKARQRYLGFVPHDRLQEIYRQADIFVFPSLAEGGVYVIYEALACGLPCIVSEHAGSAVRDGVEGFVVPVGDVERLADRIRRLRDDEPLRRRMSLAARARAERFSWREFYRRVGLLYSEVLGRGGACAAGVTDLFER